MKANTNTHVTNGLATELLAGEGNMKRYWIVRGAWFGGVVGGVGAAVAIIFELGPLDQSWGHSGGALGYAFALVFRLITDGIICAVVASVAGAGIAGTAAWIWQQIDARADATLKKREKELEESKRGRS